MGSIPSVSVIIIFYNAGRFLSEAVESVVGQTEQDWELVLADDGSTDRSTAIAWEYAGKLAPKVRYVEHPEHRNQGMSPTRNLGIRSSSSEWVAFLDADDVWNPEKCAVQMAHFNEFPELVGSAAHVRNFLSEEAAAGTVPHGQLVTLGTTLMVRRSLFDAVGMLNSEYWHRDLQDLLVRAEDRGFKIEILRDVLAQRRIHSNNMSSNRSGADHLELIAITRARHARRRAAGA